MTKHTEKSSYKSKPAGFKKVGSRVYTKVSQPHSPTNYWRGQVQTKFPPSDKQ